MARKRPRTQRKRRTREHIIADLAVHHLQGAILRVGFTAERVVHDYGLDLNMTTYNADGESEPGWVMFQLKSTDHLLRTADGTRILVRVDRADLDAWREQMYPVILIVYDAQAAVGYWFYVQASFREEKGTRKRVGKTVTVPIPAANVINEDSIRRFSAALAAMRTKMKGIQHHV